MLLGNGLTMRVLFSLGLVAVLLFMASGLPHLGMAMDMDEHGNMNMPDCYMPGMATLCTMNALDHLAWWQGMFTSIPVQSLILTLLLFLASALVFTWLGHALSPPSNLHTFARTRRREYVPLSTPLQELFSSGILHSKAY